MQPPRSRLPALSLLLVLNGLSRAEEPAPQGAISTLPVREVTVFKDGHALLLHESVLPVDRAGNVLLDTLPAPVLGTFWPFSADPKAKLASVVVGQRKVRAERGASSLFELLQANIGAEGIFNERGTRFPATLLAILDPDRDALDQPPDSTASLTAAVRAQRQGVLILLKTEEGTKATALEGIMDVTFKSPPRSTFSADEVRNLLTLRLDWQGEEPAASARVGMAYLQRGIRWIPSYRVRLDRNGKALIQLEATILNEIVDLEGATLNLVVGVPTIVFKETPDPTALQESLARLSRYFQDGTQTPGALSSAILTQVARMGEHRSAQAGTPGDSAGAVPMTSGSNEDLFVFTVRNITLKRNERMVLPIAECTVPYEDVFTLDLPFLPPPEVRRHSGTGRDAELARLLGVPKVLHKVRLRNESAFPLTTAPALIFTGERVAAQGMMSYTASGATTDLEVTAAVDLRVQKSDRVVKRTPDAARWNGSSFFKIDLEGAIEISSLRAEPVSLEVSRHLLGSAASPSHEGKVVSLDLFDQAPERNPWEMPHWWSWYSWPNWWHHLNGMTRLDWKVKLEPGKTVQLNHAWSYHWQ